MIERGMGLPSLSLRWPDSILWLIRVLRTTTSPAEADFGAFTRGRTPSAICLSPSRVRSAAAAADGDFHVLLRLGKAAISHLRHSNHVLRASQTNARLSRLRPGQWAEIERRNAGRGVAGCQNHDRRRAFGADFDRHGVAVFRNLERIQ